MRTINTRRHSAGRERGAALIVAIGVLTLLIVIALTFFRASLGDMKTAQNTVDGVRAELLADGATAVAIGFLNHDRLIHPTYSSLDHAWRTYFNGAWAVGKPWLWAPLADPSLLTTDLNYIHRLSLLRGGIPEVDQFKLRAVNGLANLGGAPTDAIYIPRADFTVNASGELDPLIPPQNYRTFEHDGIDNDGDGATDEVDELTILQNPFVTTGDLADPTTLAKFPPFEAMYASPALADVIFPEDMASLSKTVYDEIAPTGRGLSLVRTIEDETDETLANEQIDFFTDVDNDGDGLRDSMWLPVGSDRFFPDDGLDNDLDGRRDALGADGIDQSVGDPLSDDDEDGEPGVFMYRGDTDGIDNDGDGVVDENDDSISPFDPNGEKRIVIFTVQRPLQIDLDANGTLDPVLPTVAADFVQFFPTMGITANDTVLFEGKIFDSGVYEEPIGYGRNGNAIFTRDNDYDLVIDQPMDASTYMLTPEAVQALIDVVVNGQPTSYPYVQLLRTIVGDANIIAFANTPGTLTSLQMDGLIRGETVTELAGRMAILITDESSKVNINATGGWAYPVFPDLNNLPSYGPLLGLDTNFAIESSTKTTPIQRGFADGVGPVEYDTRVLPQIGASRARWMWQYLMGAREGFFAQNLRDPDSVIPYNEYTLAYHANDFEMEADATLPGYGFVDDNANLLQLALDGINNHGGPNYLLNPSIIIDPRIDNGLAGGKWEGIDEPAEYQRFRPIRDLVAEGIRFNLAADNRDNDGDDIVNEIGEIGDQFYRTHQQLKLIQAGEFDTGTFSGVRGLNDDNVFENVRNLVTAHSTDRNDRHAHPDSVLADFTRAVGRQTTGLRKDLNITRPQDVARAVTRDWSYPASVAQQWTVSGGALVAPISPPLDFGEALGTPGRTVDFLAGLRQENTTVTTSQPIMGLPPQPVSVAFTMLADAELRAHQVAATIKDFADRDYTRSVDDEIFVEDRWWQGLAQGLAQTQRIYYTTAGLEAIRINEVNVRPVRRFEAEAITDLSAADANVAVLRGLDPNRFVPHNGSYPPTDLAAAEAIEEQGFRIRVTTTTEAIVAFNLRTILDPNLDDANLEVVTTGTDPDLEGDRWNRRPAVLWSGFLPPPRLPPRRRSARPRGGLGDLPPISRRPRSRCRRSRPHLPSA